MPHCFYCHGKDNVSKSTNNKINCDILTLNKNRYIHPLLPLTTIIKILKAANYYTFLIFYWLFINYIILLIIIRHCSVYRLWIKITLIDTSKLNWSCDWNNCVPLSIIQISNLWKVSSSQLYYWSIFA